MDKNKIYKCCDKSIYEFLGYQHTKTTDDTEIYIEVHQCTTCGTIVKSFSYFFEDKPSEEVKPPEQNILL